MHTPCKAELRRAPTVNAVARVQAACLGLLPEIAHLRELFVQPITRARLLVLVRRFGR